MKSILKILMALFLCLGSISFSSCTDEDDQSTQNFENLILGTWNVYKVGMNFYEFGEYIGYEEYFEDCDPEYVFEDYDPEAFFEEVKNLQISFENNGTVVMTNDGETFTAAWSIDENQLYLTVGGENGKYTIEELNSSNMVLYLEPNPDPHSESELFVTSVRLYCSKI